MEGRSWSVPWLHSSRTRAILSMDESNWCLWFTPSPGFSQRSRTPSVGTINSHCACYVKPTSRFFIYLCTFPIQWKSFALPHVSRVGSRLAHLSLHFHLNPCLNQGTEDPNKSEPDHRSRKCQWRLDMESLLWRAQLWARARGLGCVFVPSNLISNYTYLWPWGRMSHETHFFNSHTVCRMSHVPLII